MRRLSLLLLLPALLLLSACSSKSDFYRLHPSQIQRSGSHPLYTRQVLGIGEVQVPDYLEKSAMVTFQNKEQVKIHEEQRWAGSLDKNIQSVLTQNLSALLPHTTVLAYPWNEPLRDRYRLYLSVDHFDGDANGTVTLSGHWSLVDQESDEVTTGESFHYTERGTPDTPGIVATQSRLLERLSRRIAAKVRRYYR